MSNFDMVYEDNFNECCSNKKRCGAPQVILNSGSCNAMLLPVNNVNCCGQTNPLLVAMLSLDTRLMKKAIVKIDFSSMINYKTAATFCSGSNYFLKVVFRLSRVAENGSSIAIGNWNYEMSREQLCMGEMPVNNGSVGMAFMGDVFSVTDFFGFTWNDCQECTGCNNYLLEIVDIQSCNIEYAAISNVSINGIAVSSC